jgi:hypothetical protein
MTARTRPMPASRLREMMAAPDDREAGAAQGLQEARARGYLTGLYLVMAVDPEYRGQTAAGVAHLLGLAGEARKRATRDKP